MNINGVYFNYYQVCKRKLWLFANGINMEHTSDTVYDGKLLHETSYPQRAERYEEMLISAEYEDVTLFGKIDYFDARNKVIHEIKRSDKVDDQCKNLQELQLLRFLLCRRRIKPYICIIYYKNNQKSQWKKNKRNIY